MTNLTDLDVTSLSINSTVLTATPAELNTSFDYETQAMTANGAITIKNGVVTLNKAGVLAATLAQPTATTDDFKRLRIVSLSAQLHTVTIPATGWGGNTALTVATMSSEAIPEGKAGDALELIAYQGIWYVTGFHQILFT